MEKINSLYKAHCQNPSDINEHLPTLLKYASECNHITEMGVRWVSSTWALLLSKPEKMISYDIVKHQSVENVLNLAREYNLNYSFIESDVLKVSIEQTELLFIDTLHTYNQLISELKLHSKMSTKYIILHDTETFGHKDEVIYVHASEIIKSKHTEKVGLWNAVLDFLSNEEDGQNWEVFEKFTNNNGLTILKRK
jgi:hypothetical protein